jgi:heat shock protein 1/8
MVGGSTRIPKIRAMISEYFNGKILNFSVNPDEAVAVGAAIQAAKLNGDDSKLIKSIFLLDVIPLSIGVGVEDGSVDVLIRGNTPIPIKMTKVYETSFDY